MLTSRNIIGTKRRRIAVLSLVAMVSCLMFSEAEGGIVTAVTGNANNGGEPNSIFTIDTNTGVVSKIGSASITPNAFAYAPANDIFYYGDHNSDDFYYFDPSTGTDTKIAEAVIDFGAPAGSRFSGPGDFYQNRYYFVPEQSSGQPYNGSDVLYYVDLAANGKSWTGAGQITIGMPTGKTGFGDFGDIAINPNTGILYGQTIARNSDQIGGLYSIDLNVANPTLTMINTSSAASTNAFQLAFNQYGELFGNRYDGNSEIIPIDISNGNLGATITLVGLNGDFFDMGSVHQLTLTVTPVPEPASLHLLFFATLICSWWSRRRSLRVKPDSETISPVAC